MSAQRKGVETGVTDSTRAALLALNPQVCRECSAPLRDCMALPDWPFQHVNPTEEYPMHEHNAFLCPSHATDCTCPDKENTTCNPYQDVNHCPQQITAMPCPIGRQRD